MGGVVEADHAAHHKAAVGDVVHVAGGPFLEDAIDEEGANFERLLAGSRAGWIAGFGIRHFPGRAQDDGMGFARGGDWCGDRECCEKEAEDNFRRACMKASS